MKRHYIYFALFVLFFSLPACEMKKEILGQLDEEEMTEPSTEGMGVLDLELNPERESAIPDTKGATVLLCRFYCLYHHGAGGGEGCRELHAEQQEDDLPLLGTFLGTVR